MQLFQNLSAQEQQIVKEQTGALTKRFQKGTTILRAGKQNGYIFTVLSGAVQIESNDAWGNKSIINIVQEGEVFAEAYAFIPGEEMLVDVVAKTDCALLLLSAQCIFTLSDSDLKNRLIQNLLYISSEKNLHLSRRMHHTAPKRVRERVMSYLSEESEKQGSSTVTIVFDRQQMADYLCVERSALSRELSKMKRDGLIDYRKNLFKLYI